MSPSPYRRCLLWTGFILLISIVAHTSASEIQFDIIVSRDLESDGHIEEKQNNFWIKRDAPAKTSSPDCPDADTDFYVTTHNYTWQIQCVTTYDGDMISQVNSQNFSDCITQCAQYNHNTNSAVSFCHGVTFNGPADDGSGACSLWQQVDTVNRADEEGLIEDSALLIYGPTGFQYAAPEDPAVIPGVTLINVATNVESPTISTSTVIETSVIVVTSCGPEVTNCPAHSTPVSSSGPILAASTTPASSAPLSLTSFSISIAGPRPIASTTFTVPVTAIAMSIPYTSPNSQHTYTTFIPTTTLELQAVVFCSPVPGGLISTTSCSTATETLTVTAIRTELYCLPAPCSGVEIVTGAMAKMASTEICIRSF